jgi:AAA family ATP:ADP antiporter
VQSHPLGGLALVWRDEYLLLLALLAVLLNCVNTTGEYVLAELALRDAARQIAADPSLDKAVLIADFYGSYYFAVNTATVIFQVFLVGKLFRWIGARGALLVLPVVALVGYGLVAFLPVFAIVRAVKILENSTEYSIMNTVRHVLYLPLPAQQQFEGKTAIDTFFWRLGDVVQAGIVFAGLHWLDMDYRDFALLNMLLAVAWIVIAAEIGGRYEGNARRRAPRWRLPALGACAAAGFALVAVGLPRDAGAGDAPRLAEAAGAAWRAPQAVVAAAR